MIRFNCPKCGVGIKAKPERARRAARCPKCGETIRVPGPAGEEVVKAGAVVEPYELKGDRLGMSLADFKARHHRVVPGHNETAPWCSDTREGVETEPLFSKPYFASAGLVNCRLDFPFETMQGEPAPTIAGVPTQHLLYHFVDAKLYMISASFELAHTEDVLEALAAKYGSPLQKTAESYGWGNGVSTVVLKPGKRKNQWGGDPTLLVLAHTELQELATSREPGPAVHDL